MAQAEIYEEQILWNKGIVAGRLNSVLLLPRLETDCLEKATGLIGRVNFWNVLGAKSH
jgi:hypothetical protein